MPLALWPPRPPLTLRVRVGLSQILGFVRPLRKPRIESLYSDFGRIELASSIFPSTNPAGIQPARAGYWRLPRIHMNHYEPGLAVVSTGPQLHIWRYKSAADRDAAAKKYISEGWAKTIESCDVLTHGWKTPNRADVHTGLKAFDEQCTGLSPGNQIGNTVFSMSIRPRNETHCNGHTFGPGALQAFDLRPFESDDFHCARVIRYIQQLPLAQNEHLQLSVLFHRRSVEGQIRTIVHGAILTNRMLRLVHRFDALNLGLADSYKSRGVMDTAVSFLTDKAAINRTPITMH